MSVATDDTVSTTPVGRVSKRSGSKRLATKAMIFVRRAHLYAGLFLLPWVFLFGLTGAMFNHQGLFPDADIVRVDADALASAPMTEFPTASALAKEVAASLDAAATENAITLADDHHANYTSAVMFESSKGGQQRVVRINPVDHSSTVTTYPPGTSKPKRILNDVRQVKLSPNPLRSASESVEAVLTAAAIEETEGYRPFGNPKLNFIAMIDDEPARVTYAVKNGNVEITEFNGETGFSLRSFFLRLHTTHIPAPTWNARTVWVVAADVTGFAFVVWGVTGLLMWWQIKRTRLMGSIVILASIATAAVMYFSMHEFFATTKL